MAHRCLILTVLLAGCPVRYPPDGLPRDADPVRDAGRDAGVCPCDPGDLSGPPVLIDRECVPPLSVGCLAETCTIGSDECGAGRTCQECAAAACCVCAACLPACVADEDTEDPVPDLLKIDVTYGPAGEEQRVEIQGYPFYVGALIYTGKMGDSVPVGASGGETCSLTFRFAARGPGMVPVFLSQYGGDPPWILAGFFTYSSGDLPTCVQPGYACASPADCCETTDVPMTCAGGRCRRE
jgi:hypothetical protein